MSEPTNRQTVTITYDEATRTAARLSTIAIVVTMLCASFVIAVSGVTVALAWMSYDRSLQHTSILERMELRVLTVEAYYNTRTKADGSGSVQGDSVRRPAESGDR